MCNGGGCLINPNGGGCEGAAIVVGGRLAAEVPLTRPINLDRCLTAMVGLLACGGGLSDGGLLLLDDAINGVGAPHVALAWPNGSEGWFCGGSFAPDVAWRLLTLLAAAVASARQEAICVEWVVVVDIEPSVVTAPAAEHCAEDDPAQAAKSIASAVAEPVAAEGLNSGGGGGRGASERFTGLGGC